MHAKIIPPEKEALLEEFNAAQRANAEYETFLKEFRASRKTISTEMLERAEVLFRRVMEAKIAIDNMP